MNLYLILNVVTIAIPLALTFEKRVAFYTKLNYYVPALVITAVLFLLWDIAFTKQGVWSFNPQYLSGIYFINLPLEEVLFFITVPYACIFVYETFLCYQFTYKKKWFVVMNVALLLGFSIVLLFSSGLKLYTLVVAISTILILILSGVLFRWENLKNFFLPFYVCLIPFFIVNGILTGSGIKSEIVSYNPAFFSGIRLFTIPLEDILYYTLLFLLNSSLFELFRKKLRVTRPGI